jgi:hypothetical protein
MREVAREMLQATITLETPQRRRRDIAPWCQKARMIDVHTRTVRPQTVVGAGCLRVRTFQCRRWGAARRPDAHHLGVPAAGDCTDAGRGLSAPVVAARPQRGANALLQQGTGGPRSARGAQGLIAHTADDLSTWQVACEGQEAAAVASARGAAPEGAALRRELAREGVMAHLDGRGQEVQVACHGL